MQGTYTVDSHPNGTKPTQENSMNVNGYKPQKTHRSNENVNGNVKAHF